MENGVVFSIFTGYTFTINSQMERTFDQTGIFTWATVGVNK